MSHAVLARALTAFVARRFIRLASIVTLVAFALICLVVAALVYAFSPWWWLLLLPFTLLMGILLVIRIMLLFVTHRIHHDKISDEQSKALHLFVDKVQGLLEARATPLPLIVLICLKDILLHRDIVTLRSIIKDSAGLRADYQELEKLF